jgi:4-hydroxy-3-methylbut-2-enyl diphosphate reductase
MQVNLDPDAGFCFGVKRAIKIAEEELSKFENLLCLGEIVHNEEEIHRLGKAGLQTVGNNEVNKQLKKRVLFRAHGEPPATYEKAKENQLEIIDATCPVVLKLQQRIRSAYLEMKPVDGQIAIIGSKNHPEIIGLAGQTDGEAIILETESDTDRINYRFPLRLYIQTTKDKTVLDKMVDLITMKFEQQGITKPDFKYFNTVCSQVSGRIPKLREFCRRHEVIIFVSGKNSSNGRYLFGECRSVNARSHFISAQKEIDIKWFDRGEKVGISGATSTPVWLMEQIAEYLRKI